MKFTNKGSLMDKQIKEKLDIVCTELKKQIPNIISIILSGSFAYGEGPVKTKNKKIYPFNDFDIYVITQKPISAKKVDKIASKTANKLGLTGIKYFYNFKKEDQTLEKNFYIDLKCMTREKLKNVLPRLRFYKFKKYTAVIYGKDVKNLVPEFKLKQIPLSEPAKFLLDRMSQMIEYYSTKRNYDKDVLTYFIQQAYAAMSTSLTMITQTYTPSYKKTMENLFKEYKAKHLILYQRLPKLHKRIKKYINWKLNPQKLPDKDIKKAWLICANDLIEVSKYFFSRYLNKKISSIDDLSRTILRMSSKFYTPYLNYLQKQKTKINLRPIMKLMFPILSFYLKYNYYERLKIFNKTYKKPLFNKYSPDAYIFASAPYMLTAITEKGINKENMGKAKKILGKVYPIKSQDWEDLSLEYARAYIAFFMQKIG